MDIKKLQELAGIEPQSKEKLDESIIGKMQDIPVMNEGGRFRDSEDIDFDEASSGVEENCAGAVGGVNMPMGEDETGGIDDVDLGYDVNDHMIDMDDDPLAMPDAEVSDTAGVLDSYDMIIQIMDASDKYSYETLERLPADRLASLHKKLVNGETIGEEENAWGSENGYQTMPDGAEEHMRAGDAYQGAEGFATGQADNEFHNIGNTGGHHADNPADSVAPVKHVEEASEINKILAMAGMDPIVESEEKDESDEGDEECVEEKSELDKIHSDLNEAFKAFCDDYEKSILEDADVIYGEYEPCKVCNGEDDECPACCDDELEETGYAGRMNRLSSFDRDSKERRRAHDAKKKQHHPKKDNERKLELVDDIDPTTMDYNSGEEMPDLEHDHYAGEIDDLERGDVSIDDLDASGELGMHMADIGGHPDELADVSLDPDAEIHGDAMTDGELDAEWEEWARDMREFNGIERDEEEHSGRDETGNYIDVGKAHPNAGTPYPHPDPAAKGSFKKRP